MSQAEIAKMTTPALQKTREHYGITLRSGNAMSRQEETTYDLVCLELYARRH